MLSYLNFQVSWNSELSWAPYTFQPRPWIPRLFLRMTAGLRNKLSSEGVTVKRVDPKTGKKTVSDTQLIVYKNCHVWTYSCNGHDAVPIISMISIMIYPYPAMIQLRSGGPKLKSTEEYPVGFGRTLALRHIFGKDQLQSNMHIYAFDFRRAFIPIYMIDPTVWKHAMIGNCISYRSMIDVKQFEKTCVIGINLVWSVFVVVS